MTKQLKWRLGKLPTSDEVLKLVNDKIITKEEARDILFNEQDTDKRDEKSLEEEIKFLRELVEKLSVSKDRIVEVIKTVQVPYYQYQWYQPYQYWCGTTIGTSGSFTTTGTSNSGSGNSTICLDASQNATNTAYCSTSGSGVASGTAQNFSDIQTF